MSSCVSVQHRAGGGGKQGQEAVHLKQVLPLLPHHTTLAWCAAATGMLHPLCCCCLHGSAPTNPNRCCCVSGSQGIIASTPCRCHSRVLVAHLVVHVLAHLLKDRRADFRELDLSELRLGERACTRVPGCHIKPLTTLGCLHMASCITLGAEHVPDRV